MNLLNTLKQYLVVFKTKLAKHKQKRALLKALTRDEIKFDDLVNFVSIISNYGFKKTNTLLYSIKINAEKYGTIKIDNNTIYRAFTITVYTQSIEISVILDIKVENNDSRKKTITIGESRYTEKPKYKSNGRYIFFREFIFHDYISTETLETIMVTPTVKDQVDVLKSLLRDCFKYTINELIKWS